MQVLDYSWDRPNLNTIKSLGYIGVMRYLSHDTTGKNITPSEAQAILAAGLEYGCVWEDAPNAVQRGASQGVADAQAALAQANTLSYNGPLYFAIDYDAPESDQPAIDSYFQGVASVIGANRTGVYGGYWPVKRLFDAGLVSIGWQTVAWSGGNKEARCSLYQNGAQALGCDIDDVLKTNWNTGGNVPSSQQPADETVIRLAYNLGLFRDASPAEVALWQGQTVEQVLRGVQASQEWSNNQALLAAAHKTQTLAPGTYLVK